VLAGPAVNLPTLYDSHRLVVAPTRFASGIPYRVFEAASFGVPVVATSLLCEQMGWKDNTELLATDAGDPSGFAARVVALYRSESLWTRLREAAMARLRRDNDRSSYIQKIQALLSAHHSSDDTGAEKPAIASASRPAIRNRPSFSQGSCQT